MIIVVVPAYGRDYKTDVEVKKAWEAGKDFQIRTVTHPNNGGYINKEDAENHKKGITAINIRYNKLTEVLVINP